MEEGEGLVLRWLPNGRLRLDLSQRRVSYAHFIPILVVLKMVVVVI